MRVDINQRKYCTCNSQHMDIIYLFIKDQLDKVELSIMYCQTYPMLADYSTKPLQGYLFNKCMDMIKGEVIPHTLLNT